VKPEDPSRAATKSDADRDTYLISRKIYDRAKRFKEPKSWRTPLKSCPAVPATMKWFFGSSSAPFTSDRKFFKTALEE